MPGSSGSQGGERLQPLPGRLAPEKSDCIFWSLCDPYQAMFALEMPHGAAMGGRYGLSSDGKFM